MTLPRPVGGEPAAECAAGVELRCRAAAPLPGGGTQARGTSARDRVGPLAQLVAAAAQARGTAAVDDALPAGPVAGL